MPVSRASLAKVTAPQIRDAVPRKRLFQALDRARERPLIWVSGPAGAGKTTLVASYLDARDLPHVWYRLDETDADLATFFFFLGRAVKQATPRKRKPMPLYTPEYAYGTRTFALRWFTELFERVGRPFLLVLDDVQELPEDADVYGVIQEALTCAPEGCGVLLISRQDPTAAYAKVRDQTEVLPPEALALTAQEARELAKTRAGRKVKRDTLDELRKRTQGWVAGFLLLLGSERLETADLDLSAPEIVFDYFAAEVLRIADDDTRDFLLRTAPLTELTGQTAARLSGRGDAARRLARLHRENLFTVRYPGSPATYRYHPLFREFLLARAEEALPAGEWNELLQQAGHALAESGRIDDACLLFRRSAQWDALAALLEGAARDWLGQGRFRKLGDWIDALPDAIVTGRPWLSYWRGTAELPLDPAGSLPKFQRAYTEFSAGEEFAGAALAWAGAVFSLVYAWGDCRPLDEWIQRLRHLQTVAKATPTADVPAQIAHAAFCALMYRRPEDPELKEWEAWSRSMLDAKIDPGLRMSIGYFLVLYYTWWVGNLPEATVMLQALRSQASGPGVDPLTQIRWHLMEAIHAWFDADATRCQMAIEAGLACGKNTGVHLLDFILLTQGAYNALTAGDLDAADDALSRMEAAIPMARKVDLAQYHYLRSVEALARGDLPQARAFGREALKARELGLPFAEVIVLQGLAHIEIAAGDLDAARGYLAEARGIAEPMGSHSGEFWCAIVAAHLERLEGAGTAELARLFRLVREHGYSNAPLWRPVVVADLCVAALDAGIEPDTVRRLVRKRSLAPTEAPVGVPGWPWALEVRTLGPFAVVADGTPLEFPRKAQKKTLALLKCLIGFGGSGVSEAQLAEQLWPDSEGDAAHQAFATALHRLRKLVGVEALVLRDGRLTLDPRTCWVDASAFEAALDALDSNEDPAVASGLLERVFALYRGPFLAGHDDSWAFGRRERL